MKLSDALREAQSRGLDLVEVAPTANPPSYARSNIGLVVISGMIVCPFLP